MEEGFQSPQVCVCKRSKCQSLKDLLPRNWSFDRAKLARDLMKGGLKADEWLGLMVM